MRTFPEHYGAADFLDLALSAERWISGAEYRRSDGIAWRCCPDNPSERISTHPSPNGFYAGRAGFIFFYLSLYNATKNTAYLAKAKEAGDAIVNSFTRTLAENRMMLEQPIANSEWNLYSGAAGESCALVYLGQATGDERYTTAAINIGDAVIAAANSLDDGINWMGHTCLLLDGGIVLGLLFLYRKTKLARYYDAAAKAARHIALTGVSDARGGYRWQGIAPALLGACADSYWPTYEFGTAGIGYLFALVYEAGGDRYFLEQAERAAEHIRAIATIDGKSAYLYYGEPNDTDLYYLGNCLGSVGAAKIFYTLYRITKDEQHKDYLDRFTEGILQAGAPSVRSRGYWNNDCHCCGTAGILDYFISLWAVFGERRYLDAAVAAGRVIAGDAFNDDGRGARWYMAWERVKPGAVQAYTGFRAGAAGIGTTLVELALAMSGEFHALRFADDPWPQTTEISMNCRAET
jgi:lantibiotic modifying enzyme